MIGRRPSRRLASRLDLHVSNHEELDSEDWSFSEEDTQYLLHNLHPYPARFIPQIPRRSITRWTNPGDLVLDPFCGCGTTILECALAGRDSKGIDNNQVATLISRAKVARYGEEDFQILLELVSELEETPIESLSLGKEERSWAPDYDSRGKWFEQAAVAELAMLRKRILELGEPAQLLGLAVFSSIIVRSSRQDSDTRYAAIERPYTEGSATRLWIGRTRKAIGRARETRVLRKPSNHTVYVADSRQLPMIDDETIDLIVTSPPYLNAYDYHKYHRHRLHWIDGDVSFARDMEIGKHDTFTRPRATPEPFFTDLRTCMREWKRVLKQGARALVVIGDAIVSKKFVPVGDRLAEIGQEMGLNLERRWVRNLSTTKKSFNQSARIKREHLLLFRSSG